MKPPKEEKSKCCGAEKDFDYTDKSKNFIICSKCGKPFIPSSQIIDKEKSKCCESCLCRGTRNEFSSNCPVSCPCHTPSIEKEEEKKIIEYSIVFSSTEMIDLESDVNFKLKYGWQPLGGVFKDNNGVYYQGMVKYE